MCDVTCGIMFCSSLPYTIKKSSLRRLKAVIIFFPLLELTVSFSTSFPSPAIHSLVLLRKRLIRRLLVVIIFSFLFEVAIPPPSFLPESFCPFTELFDYYYITTILTHIITRHKKKLEKIARKI